MSQTDNTDDRLVELEKHIAEMFENHDAFKNVNFPSVRENFLEAVRACSFCGIIKHEWSATPKQVDAWLHENDKGPETTFRDWMEDYVHDDYDFVDRAYSLVSEGIRNKINEGKNTQLINTLKNIDYIEFFDALRDYGIISVEIEIVEPVVRANFMFATKNEIARDCDCINMLNRCLNDDEVANACLTNKKLSASLHDNAFSHLLDSCDTTLAEVLRTGKLEEGEFVSNKDDYDEADYEVFKLNARQEFEFLPASSKAILTVLTETTPDELFEILNAPSVKLAKGATMGLYNPCDGTGSDLVMSLPNDGATLGTDLIYDIEIEDGNKPSTIGNNYKLSRDCWQHVITDSDELPYTKPEGIRSFNNIVKARIKQRKTSREAEEIYRGMGY